MEGQSVTVAAPAPRKKFVAYSKDCALLAGPSGPVIGAGKTFGAGVSVLQARLMASTVGPTAWMGFSLSFPLGDDQVDNEKAGFGVRYHSKSSNLPGTRNGVLAQFDWHRVGVMFPRSGFVSTFEDPPPSLASLFPGARKLCLLSVRLLEGAQVKVDGFGMPFANFENPEVERWVNGNEPIVAGTTLLDLVQKTEFHVLVLESPVDVQRKWSEEHLPPPFSYPYGTEHDWDWARYRTLLPETKSTEQFWPAYSFDDDNAHVAVRTQCVVQDVFWLQVAVEEISDSWAPAYFINRGADDHRYYAVITLPKEFRDRFKAAWTRLAKDNDAVLKLASGGEEDEDLAEWECTIVEHPQAFTELQSHPTEDHELVMMVSRPGKGQKGNGFKRKVAAACHLLPTAGPTNNTGVTGRELAERMELHRTLMRGSGFYNWMTNTNQAPVPEPEEPSVEQALANRTLDQQPPPVRTLPVVNLLDVPDDKYTRALLEEALPRDRAPFSQYLSRRHLGLGIITAPPGFGKTTLLSIAGLAMQASLGKILCSGPTNVAVDNLASRLEKISTSVCQRYNDGKPENDPSRQRRRFVVRAYMARQELAALMQLLRFPDKEVSLVRKSAWKLHLSVAYWFLVLLGSKAKGIRELEANDSEALHQLRRDIEGRDEFTALRAVAAGEMSWADFTKTKSFELQPMMKQIVLAAELLCITPARSAEINSPCQDYKKKLATGILIDEAANMTIPDYICVSGNCLLPCVIGGDPRQLKPLVLTGMQKDEAGNFYHRLAQDATMSPLAFLQASGIPVYRLSLQLRIARGLFDWVGAEVYPEIRFGYAQHCNIPGNNNYGPGRALEDRARARFPEVAPAGLIKFSPLFLHCEGSRVYIDKTTKSKLCPVQARATLDFALDLVTNTTIKTTDIVILCPYAANVKFINNLMKRPGYAALVGMAPASTVDSYQGQESDIVLVTMGTTFPYPGPGFTTDRNRLNVLLTRQRCGLVVVGDINIDGKQEKKKEKARPGQFMVRDAEGKIHWTKALMLYNIYKRFVQEKRVMRLPQAPEEDNVVDGPAA
ncbi:P-loop containing nucleoside triphosphate hydrolase protein [Chaetomidium leptoderma]|uniref:P-loop containing nucleoside triphosphate hydrolase protein n=1 Tax=Chaetomidium leptoderma TaxID=669021 RepID=A0AAN6VH82_9PEZI|nr:P-loop containing nucleoside triphosphate hydrolase protein [Chaetomidium leptoderma]